jgi:hypothetical protein
MNFGGIRFHFYCMTGYKENRSYTIAVDGKRARNKKAGNFSPALDTVHLISFLLLSF